MRGPIIAYLVREATKQRTPGKKAVQKLVYFVQEAGVPLGFRYGIHLFGPYSPALSEFIDGQISDGTLQCERDGMSTLITPGPGCEMVIKRGLDKINPYKNVIDRVILDFAGRTPLDLEILSTVHFVAKQCPEDDRTVIDTTLRLKGNKSSAIHIANCLSELRELRYLTPNAPATKPQ